MNDNILSLYDIYDIYTHIAPKKVAHRRRHDYTHETNEFGEDDGKEYLTLEELLDIKGNNLLEWVQRPIVKLSIMKHFSHFLRTYTIDEKNVYAAVIDDLTESMYEHTCIWYL